MVSVTEHSLLSRVVVLGAGGFIGRRIVEKLSSSDLFQIVAAGRHPAALSGKPHVEALKLDASDPAALRAALIGANAVVNCIAGDPAMLLSISRGLFASAAAMQPRPRVINLGSLAAYGSAAGMVNESAELRGDLDAYSAAKAESDRLAQQYDCVFTLRPGIVYGPGSPWWSDRIARLLIRGRLGDLGPQGSGICNLVYVDDVAAAVVRALTLEVLPVGAVNLSSSGGLTWNEYFSRYAAALAVQPVRRISKLRLTVEVSLMAPPLKLFELLLRGPSGARWNPLPPIRPWLLQICGRRIQMDVSRAESVLGMQWTPLDTGLEATAEWFRLGGRTVI
jgi:2-alkyl-3-oxoalkanoate reductase